MIKVSEHVDTAALQHIKWLLDGAPRALPAMKY
jgi:hypothetical protein